jgi:hypothetical protein
MRSGNVPARRVIMNAIKATWRDGQIVPQGPVDWPDGTELRVEPLAEGQGEASAPLFQRLHPTSAEGRLALEAELDAMAADPDIQRELRHIEQEFAGTDWDGMEGL